MLTYCPGSKNGKPDALSRQHAEDGRDAPPKPILESCVIGMVTWDVREAQRQQPDPDNGPPNRLVSESMKSRVPEWAHTLNLPVTLG